MNKVYKVIWSKAKNCYVVASELAKNHTKSASSKHRLSTLVMAGVVGLFLLAPYSAFAAIDGVNKFVEVGNQNIKIGNDISLRNNAATNGAIAIGDHAQIDDYVMQEGSIAIGKNAFVENMYGNQEKFFKFGQSDEKKWASSVAIGQNTYARSGSVMIGDHKYIGRLGDVDIDGSDVQKVKSRNVNINATTLGANSYNQGAFSSVTGTYSIISGKYNGSNWSSYVTQNMGANIYGSLNSIESATSSSAYSGVANSIVGTANRTANSNGSLIFGAGNEITNSISSISAPSTGGDSAQALQKSLMTAVKNSNSGGATLAIGGGNTADWTQLSQIIGVNNTLKGTSGAISKFNMIDGYKNTVTKAEHVSVIGSENTVENSKGQTVIGDSNKITDRNAGTVSGKQEERTKNVSDLVIGKGNKIEGNDTYMKGYESLTVIGNNNEMVNPGAGIVIGDNQKVGASKESVVIGSMTPEEKADSDIGQKHASVVVGYHAQSGTRDGGGMNVALGHGAKAYGWQETVTGIKSIVEAGDSGFDGYLASVYGGLNTVASSNTEDQYDGMANTVVGTLNKTEGANGALVFGAGNSVTHSFGTAPTDENGNSMNEHWGEAILFGGQGYAGGDGMFSHDEIRKAMGLAMSTGGGSVVTMGNGNTSDYAVHSQIIGSGNILTGTANTPGINNTINGYANTGRNVERVSMMGTGNNMSGSTADVVIGDYHHMDGGKNNVILGSMATEKKAVEKTYTMKDASGNVILEQKYKVMENVPIKSHTANISNAVMLGYNTDVEKDGGVALGADSIASVDKGVAGYDPSTDTVSADTSATWKATAAAVSVGKAATPTGAAGSSAITRQITNVAAGTQDTDAVNVAQLKKLQETVTTAAGEAGKHTTVVAGDYVTVTEKPNNKGGKEYTVSGPQLTSADGTVKITDKVENGKKVGYNLSVDTAALGIENTVVSGGDNVTVAVKKDTNTHTTTYTISAKDTYTTGGSYDASTKTIEFTQNDATKNYRVDVSGLVDTISGDVNKGLNFAGDSGSAINKKLGETLAIKGGATELTDNNIGVVSESGELKVKLAKNITGVETLTVKEKITVGETVIGKDTVTTKTIKAGDTTINNDGMTINNGPVITKNNVDMHNQQIHNVADGTSKTDAATFGQVQKVKEETSKEINHISNRLNNVDRRVDKVGAGAAALAALHPVDFDADDKLDVAAGWGHYKGQNSMALGAFYRPDERTMFNIGGAFGNGENMVNAGVTFKLDKQTGPTHAITSKVQLVKEVAQLKADNTALRSDNVELRRDNDELRKNNEMLWERMKVMDAKLEKLLAEK